MLSDVVGEVAEARLEWILREFSSEGLEAMKEALRSAVEDLRRRYGQAAVSLEIVDQYANMKRVLNRYPTFLAKAREAFQLANVPLKEVPIRGGTDGARLSFMGLPCPNLFTGAGNFHGPYEYLVLEDWMDCLAVLLAECQLFAGQKRSDFLPQTLEGRRLQAEA